MQQTREFERIVSALVEGWITVSLTKLPPEISIDLLGGSYALELYININGKESKTITMLDDDTVSLVVSDPDAGKAMVSRWLSELALVSFFVDEVH